MVGNIDDIHWSSYLFLKGVSRFDPKKVNVVSFFKTRCKKYRRRGSSIDSKMFFIIGRIEMNWLIDVLIIPNNINYSYCQIRRCQALDEGK